MGIIYLPRCRTSGIQDLNVKMPHAKGLKVYFFLKIPEMILWEISQSQYIFIEKTTQWKFVELRGLVRTTVNKLSSLWQGPFICPISSSDCPARSSHPQANITVSFAHCTFHILSIQNQQSWPHTELNNMSLVRSLQYQGSPVAITGLSSYII